MSYSFDEIIISGKKVNMNKLNDLNEKEMTVADKCIKFFELIGVKYVFGIPASNNAPLFDALIDSKIELIMSKNEANSTYSASRYISASNEIGVCLLAGTVGINNAINGIGEAFVNKLPMLIISGDTARQRKNKGGTQSVDTISITKSITKYSAIINNENEVLSELIKGISICTTPPHGPVHLCIPMDVQNSKLTSRIIETITADKPCYDENALESAIEAINQHESGIIFVGKGAKNFSSQIKELSLKLCWPVISTPQGKGVMEDSFELYMGNYGMCATDFTKKFVESSKATCLLILGSSLNEASIPSFDDVLFNGKQVIHIDYDKNELNKVYNSDIAVHYDLIHAIPSLLLKCHSKTKKSFEKTDFNVSYNNTFSGLSLRYFVEHFLDSLPSKTYVVSDIGEFMTYILKYMPIKEQTRFDINTHYGPMGDGVGGAIGTYVACPDYQTFVFVGDGGFFMNGMEVLVAKEKKLPIIYCVVNNSMLGMVNNGFQCLFQRSNKEFEYETVGISQMFNAIGIKTLVLRRNEDLYKLNDFVKDLQEPCIIELIPDKSEQSPMMDRIAMLRKSMTSKV
ncbi:MAG: thiamine pyrophosphate-dependent enzyme possible carboligase or decarboxylase [Sedimentibacter sp.]|nr:thiamine pyrophosphate-dependent enzyme possible carboligase or decarboxylase [Sedimentibacter sp.]